MRLAHPPVSLVLPQPVRCSPAPPVRSAWPRPTPSARRNVRRASCIRASASSSDDPGLPHTTYPNHRRPTTCTHRQLSTAPGGNSDPPAGALAPSLLGQRCVFLIIGRTVADSCRARRRGGAEGEGAKLAQRPTFIIRLWDRVELVRDGGEADSVIRAHANTWRDTCTHRWGTRGQTEQMTRDNTWGAAGNTA